MAPIKFTVTHDFVVSPDVVWGEMINWKGHEDWIPATRIELHSADSRAVGSTFTGFTGFGPIMLEDRMEIAQIDWDDQAQFGTCVVKKLGPVLEGTAGFTVAKHGEGSRVEWFEDVTVRYLPGPLAPVTSKLSAFGFSQGMKKLAKKVGA